MKILTNPALPGCSIKLPDGYTPPPLPGRDEWLADLRGGAKQASGSLQTQEGECCLGRLCILQRRLVNGQDKRESKCLSAFNPMSAVFGPFGRLPSGVCAYYDDDDDDERVELSSINDSSYEQGYRAFEVVAWVIENVWSDGGPLLK